jgi:hypothetical protein
VSPVHQLCEGGSPAASVEAVPVEGDEKEEPVPDFPPLLLPTHLWFRVYILVVCSHAFISPTSQCCGSGRSENLAGSGIRYRIVSLFTHQDPGKRWGIYFTHREKIKCQLLKTGTIGKHSKNFSIVKMFLKTGLNQELSERPPPE